MRKITFDGVGLNDTDPYATRIAKLQPQYIDLGPEIVRAVNSHDELLHVLKRVRKDYVESEHYLSQDPWIIRMDQAIANAEGK